MIAEIPVDVREGSELLAVATFMRASDGEYTMRIANVTGAAWSPAEQAQALRMLATGVEAEAVAHHG